MMVHQELPDIQGCVLGDERRPLAYDLPELGSARPILSRRRMMAAFHEERLRRRTTTEAMRVLDAIVDRHGDGSLRRAIAQAGAGDP